MLAKWVTSERFGGVSAALVYSFSFIAIILRPEGSVQLKVAVERLSVFLCCFSIGLFSLALPFDVPLRALVQ